MPRKWKTGMAAFVLAFTALLVFPLTVSATSTSGAAFTRYAMSATQITPGQSISFTVNTTSAANFVYVYSNVDGTTTSGLLTNTLDGGEKVWTVTASPKVSQNITVYASATQEMTSSTSAATLQIPVTVSDTQGGASAAGSFGVGSAGVVVNDVSESAIGGNVTLTVRTSTLANNVWVQFDGTRFVQGRAVASNNPNEKVWTITFRPAQAQTVTVSANTRYQTNGATNISHDVLSRTASAVNRGTATITSVSVSPSTTISYNGSATLTIRTNLDTDYVWVDYDNTESDARLSSQTRTSKTWTVRISPDRTQTVTIYANSGDQTASGAATRTQRITVSSSSYNNYYDTNVGIRTASASWRYDDYYRPNNYNDNYLDVTATTSGNVSEAWFELSNYGRVSMSSDGTDSNGDRRWRYSGYPGSGNWNNYNAYNYSTITVFARASDSSYTASRTVNVSNSSYWGGGNYGGGQISQFHMASGSNAEPGGQVRFYAVTSGNVNSVRIRISDGSGNSIGYDASSYTYNIGNGNLEWSELRFTLPSGISSGRRTFTLDAYVNNQLVDSRTTEINVN